MLKLLRDNIIVQKMAMPTQVGSIYMPENAGPGNTVRCQVISTGPGLKAKKTQQLIPLEVAVGDVVYIPKFAGNPISIDTVDYLMIKSVDILGIEDTE